MHLKFLLLFWRVRVDLAADVRLEAQVAWKIEVLSVRRVRKIEASQPGHFFKPIVWRQRVVVHAWGALFHFLPYFLDSIVFLITCDHGLRCGFDLWDGSDVLGQCVTDVGLLVCEESTDTDRADTG